MGPATKREKQVYSIPTGSFNNPKPQNVCHFNIILTKDENEEEDKSPQIINPKMISNTFEQEETEKQNKVHELFTNPESNNLFTAIEDQTERKESLDSDK